MVLTVEGIVLYSEDLDRARAFYRDVLGLPLLLDEGHVIHFDAGTIRLAIHRCPPGQRREAPRASSYSGSRTSPSSTRRCAFAGPNSSALPRIDRTVASPFCMTPRAMRLGCWKSPGKERKVIDGWPRSSSDTNG